MTFIILEYFWSLLPMYKKVVERVNKRLEITLYTRRTSFLLENLYQVWRDEDLGEQANIDFLNQEDQKFMTFK